MAPQEYSLEQRLSRSLAPVAAPDELWSRVSAALPSPPAEYRQAATPRRRGWANFAMAAAIAAVMSGGVLYLRAFEPSRTTLSLEQAAMAAHQGKAAPPVYAVQRYEQPGGPVTLVSAAAEPGTAVAGPKRVRTKELDALSISEWTSQGRRWVLVSGKAAHQTACRVCHHA